ncbi:MAG TPA: cytochrome c biogenesis protein CcsA [Pseudogracilibacillus sp.]|nr:cytochrome c biogenesis protein CcsA [Pseudogracilibacillus sp.]
MFASKWIYEMMLIIYSISLVGYFVDFIKQNDRVNKVSFYLLCLVWFIQTIILYNQMFIEKNFPILTLNDGLFFYAWILLLISILLNLFFNVHFVILFTNLFSFFILLLSLSLNAQAVPYTQGSQFVHEILIIHITLALTSYGFFTISFMLAMMYLIQYSFLKKKKGFKWMWRFADLERLDLYSFYAIMIGVPLLLIGLIFGFVWAYVAPAEFYWYDIKTIGSVLVLFIYIVYLLLRILKGYRGKPISIFNSAAFLGLLINFFLFSTLSGFHF